MRLSQIAVSAAIAFAVTTVKADTLSINLGAFTSFYSTVGTTASVVTTLGIEPLAVSNLTVPSSFLGFCMEPFQLLSPASYSPGGDASYSASAFSSPRVQALYDGFYGGALSSPVTAAAFQIALWELISDPVANLAAGPGFALDAASLALPAATLAQSMLAGTGAATGVTYTLTAWRSPTSQDVLQATPVPEPSTVLSMLAGLGALGALVRRSNKA